MMMSQKVVVSLSIWTGVCVTLAGSGELELFGILLLIGVLIARELSSTFTKPELGEKMDHLIYVGLIFFVAVVAHRVLSILGFF